MFTSLTSRSSNSYKYELRLYYDASIMYNGPSHCPYFILAIGVLLIFVIIPVMILMFYPFKWFQKILNVFPVRWYVLHTFVDSFQGFYKNGIEPDTRDCRWFASVFFIIRLALLVGALTKENKSHYSIINAVAIYHYPCFSLLQHYWI